MMLTIDVERKQGDFLVQAGIRQEAAGVTALFGPSGAGKTSIVNMVAGLAKPDRGLIRINGVTLFDSGKGIDLPPEKRRIGYVFQDGRLFPHLCVRRNLTYGMRRLPPDENMVGLDEVVSLLGIGHLMDRRPARLSGGEKQRVAIGRALLTNPLLLLMDEPLASLDSARKQEVLPFIERLCREYSRPILYVSHSMDEILNIASHLVVLGNGAVADQGAIDAVMSRVDAESRFPMTDYGAVLETVVDAAEDEDGLTSLAFGGGLLKVSRMDVAAGDRLRVRIPARSVALALEKPEKISVRNIFRGKIDVVEKEQRGFTSVRVDIGSPILARITSQSAEQLNLSAGRQVYVLIKTVSISHGR